MELGATLCTPKKVLCLMCPWVKTCVSRKEDKISSRPRPKPRAEFEIWQWDFQVQIQRNKKSLEIFLAENSATPF
jgi:A/G-specific adenine glycosylase